VAARPHRATILEPASTVSGLSPRSRRGRRMRVLLVEADAQFQSMLGTELAEVGFEVAMVATAEDALAELEHSPALPGLIVAETGLEGMDGYTFCSQLRAEPRTAQVPLVLLASRREGFHPDLATSAGADDFFIKPALVQDVVALARLKAGRRSSELQFEAHAARLQLAEIAPALLAGMRSGRLVLKDGSGFFAFRNGRVVDASFEGVSGVLGLRRLLAFGSGVYGVTFGPELHRGSLLMDLPFLRSQVLPAMERFERLRDLGVPLAARLTVDFPQLAEHLSTLPDEVISLVRLFDGRRTVRAVLLECRFMEVVAFEAIMQLFMLGVLVPASHVEERERAREVSSFLEPSEGALDELVGEMEAPEDAPEGVPEEAPATAPRVVVVELPEAAPMAAVVDAPEEQFPVAADQDEEPRIPEPLMPIPVILSFQKPAARRRKDSMDRSRAAEVFHWSSGHSRNGR
jgi:CheY-like chemotaxis protein